MPRAPRCWRTRCRPRTRAIWRCGSTRTAATSRSSVNATPPSYKVGDKAQFWISNSDTQEHNQVTAELRYVTDHVAMWVEQGVRMNQRDLEASAKRFEEKTYPTNREFFGSEWTPGVDNDVRLHILHARGLGDTVAGYYSSSDEYSRMVNEYSNEREMFYISADSGNAEPNSEFYDGTLAHEFQHMIHWANDRNEDSWVNEGMSELASYLNEFDPGGAEYAYAEQPDTQLTTWADPSDQQRRALRRILSVHDLLPGSFRRGPDQGRRGLAAKRHGRLQRGAGEGRPVGALRRHLCRLGDRQLPGCAGRRRGGPLSAIRTSTSTRWQLRRPTAVTRSTVRPRSASTAQTTSAWRANGPVTIDFAGQDQVGLVDTHATGHLLMVVEPRRSERLHAHPRV